LRINTSHGEKAFYVPQHRLLSGHIPQDCDASHKFTALVQQLSSGFQSDNKQVQQAIPRNCSTDPASTDRFRHKPGVDKQALQVRPYSLINERSGRYFCFSIQQIKTLEL